MAMASSAEGHTNPTIAARLYVSEAAVLTYLRGTG
jgi:DNA-binding CsgD family transcriptional regulator